MEERTKKSIVNWALRDINEMLGVNKFLNIGDETKDYLSEFKEKIKKIDMEHMIKCIYTEYGVNNKRYPISSSLVIMGSVLKELVNGCDKFDVLTINEAYVLFNMAESYSLGTNIALVMDESDNKGTSIKVCFTKIYSNFVKEVAFKCFDIEQGIIYV